MEDRGRPREGFRRFVGPAVLGGALAGILSAVPIVNLLNCVFCLLVDGGAVLGLALALRGRSDARVSAGQAVASGAVSGLVSAVVGVALTAAGHLLLQGLHPDPMAAVGQVQPGAADGPGSALAGLVHAMLVDGLVDIPVYCGFGALAAYGALKLFFRDRAAR
jgi:hypothetical protein